MRTSYRCPILLNYSYCKSARVPFLATDLDGIKAPKTSDPGAMTSGFKDILAQSEKAPLKHKVPQQGVGVLSKKVCWKFIPAKGLSVDST